MLLTASIVCGCVVIFALGLYAGRLLFMLYHQNQQRKQAQSNRISDITSSIQVIAKAMNQQQCDLSEGTIRICKLLQLLPFNDNQYEQAYPNLFQLFKEVSNFDYLDARKALSKKEKHKQDVEREEIEVKFESKVLPEIVQLQDFSTDLIR